MLIHKSNNLVTLLVLIVVKESLFNKKKVAQLSNLFYDLVRELLFDSVTNF
jgi:hypothetical protein